MSILTEVRDAVKGREAVRPRIEIKPGESRYGQYGWVCDVILPHGQVVIREWSHDRAGAMQCAAFARHMIDRGMTPRHIEHGQTWDPPADVAGDVTAAFDDDPEELENEADAEVAAFMRQRHLDFND